ncbi:MAG: fatty-acid--CoA ligase [Rhizobacter sp.]|nr:fatty-acid--CoA ligase [Rhizobacter sp.]
MTATPSPAARSILLQDLSTIGRALGAAVERNSKAVAYIDHGRTYSFAEVDAASDAIACGLLARGFRRGDRIGLMGYNQIEWLQAFHAAMKIGVAVVALSTRYRDSEIAYMLADSEARAVFALRRLDDFDGAAMIERLRPSLPKLEQVVYFDRAPVDAAGLGARETASDFTSLGRGGVNRSQLDAASAAVGEDDLAMVIYTSGTTGKPKGTALTHRSLLASAGAQARHVDARPDDLLQLGNPLNHVGGITCCVLTFLIGGGCCELVPAFKAASVLTMMAVRPPTFIVGVTTMMTLLLMHPLSAEVDLRRVRTVITGGSTVDATLLEQLQRRMPQAAVMNLYGLSESSGAIVMTPRDASENDLMRSIGKPLEGAQAKAIGLDGEALPAGEIGELCFRGCGVVRGYIGAAAASSDFGRDGWLRTGDLASIDERGFITLKGRKKDMYIQGGFNVYPAEVEALIATHPEVMMVAGIGVADPVLGEVGRYYVVAKAGSALTVDDVFAHCASRIANYKQPRQVVLRSELPLTPAEKIHKAALRSEG